MASGSDRSRDTPFRKWSRTMTDLARITQLGLPLTPPLPDDREAAIALCQRKLQVVSSTRLRREYLARLLVLTERSDRILPNGRIR